MLVPLPLLRAQPVVASIAGVAHSAGKSHENIGTGLSVYSDVELTPSTGYADAIDSLACALVHAHLAVSVLACAGGRRRCTRPRFVPGRASADELARRTSSAREHFGHPDHFRRVASRAQSQPSCRWLVAMRTSAIVRAVLPLPVFQHSKHVLSFRGGTWRRARSRARLSPVGWALSPGGLSYHPKGRGRRTGQV